MSGRRAQGVGIIIDPRNARPLEMDTTTCCHCQKITRLHNADGSRAKDQGGFCMYCFAPTCSGCADKECAPFMKKLDAYEKQVAAHGQLFRALR